MILILSENKIKEFEMFFQFFLLQKVVYSRSFLPIRFTELVDSNFYAIARHKFSQF